MKLSLLPLLACPECGGGIKFSSLKSFPKDNEEMETGSLSCQNCQAEYPIIDGVPRLLPRADLERKMRRTRASFGWEWMHYPGSMEEDKKIFLEETQIPPAEWNGRKVLDAGCGMGRYSLVALSLGAEIVAFDLSDALLRLVPYAQKYPKLHIVQGDLFHPPFKSGAFDLIYSQGVLHHTPDTETAFRQVAGLVKKSGRLSVWVYGTPGPYKSFSTNPLRSGRSWLKHVLPLVWLVVWIRQIISDCIRVITTRLPIPILYALCFPLTMIGMIPIVKYLTFSVHPNFRVRLIENFDWLAPPYQYKHTKEEVRGWFSSAGYTALSQLAHGVVPKVGFLGKKE